MLFGVSKLLEARKQSEAEQAEFQAIEAGVAERMRKKTLAKAIVKATQKKVPVPDGERVYGTLEPVVTAQNSQEFINNLGIGSDYPVEKLCLSVEGVYAPQVYSYTLMFKNGPSSRWCGEFTATESDNGLNISVRTDATGTNLACKERAGGPWRPVEFEGEQYEFIRLTSGLFLPSVRSMLES